MKILTNYEKGFIEASIDTDGSIFIIKQKQKRVKRGWSLRIILLFYNNSTKFLDKIQKILETNVNYVEKRSKNSKNTNYELRYHHDECRWILPQLKLIIKEEKRKLAVEILKLTKHGTNQYNKTLEYEEKILEFGRKIDSIKLKIPPCPKKEKN